MSVDRTVLPTPKRSRSDARPPRPRLRPRLWSRSRRAPDPPCRPDTHIEDLPSEVLLLVFSYCSAEELRGSVARVCRRWRELAGRPCLLVALSLGSGDALTDPHERLRAVPNLRDLRVADRSDAARLVRAAAACNAKLRRLTVKACPSDGGEALHGEDLKTLLHGCPKLVELTVKASTCSQLGGCLFDDPGVRVANIRKLNFNFVSCLTHKDVRSIVERCPKLEDLRVLVKRDVDQTPLHFSDEEVDLLARNLRGTLRVLKIDGHHVTNIGMEALGTCKRLNKLWIRNASNVSDMGLRPLCRLTELVDLELTSMTHVSAKGWSRMFSKRHWPNMRRLSLIFCTNVDNDTAFLFGSSCPQLQKLNVAGCYFLLSSGLKDIFMRCVWLREVTLCLTQVKGCLFWIPVCAPLMKKIAYHSCYIVSEPHDVVKEYEVVLKAFSRRYPNLQIQLIQCLDELTSGD